MEGTDAAHAIGDEGQHVAGGKEGELEAGPVGHLGLSGGTERNLHLTALEGDDHLVIGDEGCLGTVQGDSHALLGTCVYMCVFVYVCVN